MDNSIHPLNLHYPPLSHPHLYQAQLSSTYLLNSAHLNPAHLEFSHYNHLSSSALSLVLNNDWSTALNLLQSHRDNSLVMSATHVYISMLKLFLHPSSFNPQPVMTEAMRVVERCKMMNQDLKDSSDQDAVSKATKLTQMLLNDVIASQCTACHAFLSIINNSDVISSAFNVKKAFAFHKRVYSELLQYVEKSYTYTDDTAKNKNNNNNENNNKNNNNTINTDENNNDNNNNSSNSNNNSEKDGREEGKEEGGSGIRSNDSSPESSRDRLVGFFGGLLKPLNKRIFPESGFNSLATKGNTKSYHDNDEEDEEDEDDDDDDDNDDGKLENVYGFVDMCVWKRISEGYDLFKEGACTAAVKEKDGLFAGMFERKSTRDINTYPTTGLTLNKAHLSKLLGLVSFGYGLSLAIIFILPLHPLITTAINFLGVTDSKPKRPFEAFEMLAVSAFSGSFVSPISCCLLLYFLCIYRDHFVISENNFAPERNVRMVERLLGELERHCGDCVFKYYFKAKLAVMKGRVREAQRVLKAGIAEVSIDEQIKGLCEYDLCRVYMMKFDWVKSSKSLDRLLDSLVAPHPHYMYLLIISQGARERLEVQNLKALSSLGRKKKYKKEFFSERVAYLAKESQRGSDVFKMLCYEAVYMWGGFRGLKIQQLDTVVGVCQKHLQGPFHSLACLLTGVCLANLIEKRVKQNHLSTERFFGIESWFLQALQGTSHPAREEHVVAMCCYEMACLKERELDFEGARGWCRKAKSHDRNHVVFKWNMVDEMVRSLEGKEKKLKNERDKEEKDQHNGGMKKNGGEKKEESKGGVNKPVVNGVKKDDDDAKTKESDNDTIDPSINSVEKTAEDCHPVICKATSEESSNVTERKDFCLLQ